MKIKRFDNLWAMGLILFGVLLLSFYIIKIFFPDFIVGVAELPSIVEFGNYVDSHKWAYYLFHFIVSFSFSYIYCCSCLRVKTLNLVSIFIILGFICLSFLIQEFLVNIYTPYTYASNILMPFVILFVNKSLSEKTFISTAMCYCIDIGAQALSLVIRDIIILAVCINSATMTILLIDTWIWRILLYLFFNYKEKKE